MCELCLAETCKIYEVNSKKYNCDHDRYSDRKSWSKKPHKKLIKKFTKLKNIESHSNYIKQSYCHLDNFEKNQYFNLEDPWTHWLH
jgi:hypothetical protein